MPPAELSERIALLAGEEAIAQAGIGTKGHFPGPLFLALAAARNRMARSHQDGGHGLRPMQVRDLSRSDAGGGRAAIRADLRDASNIAIIGEHLAEHFGTEGSPISLNTACASGASAIQLGVEAIRRGECEAALAIGADGSLTPESLVRFSLLSALSTQNDPPEHASKPFSKNRDGFVLAEGAARSGARRLRSRPRARRQGARHPRRLRREIRFVSSHPVEPRRQADHRLHAQCARRCRRRPGRHRLHQRPRHLDAGERQDGVSRRLDRVRRAHPRHSDLVEQIDDRPHADGSRRGGGGVHGY